MKIHKEGYRVIAVFFILLSLILGLLNVIFPIQTIIHYLLYASAAVFYFLVIRFFRVPFRTVDLDENAILSAADGEVVAIEEVVESEYYHGSRRQISVFMSPLNVHINYFPISGEVVYKRYHPGKFLVAWHPKSSTLNERSTFVVEDIATGKSVLFRQIAGFVARRIVPSANQHDQAIQGEEFGMIKFGSRVDIFIPLDAKVNVEIGQKVTARKTVIAYFK
jgi:phosphatidylserine decarboxylase